MAKVGAFGDQQADGIINSQSSKDEAKLTVPTQKSANLFSHASTYSSAGDRPDATAAEAYGLRSKEAIRADKRREQETSAAEKLQGQLQQHVEGRKSLEGKKSGGRGSKRHSKLSGKERASRTTLTSNNGEQRNSGGVRDGACTRASIPFVVEESKDLAIMPGKDSSGNSSGMQKQLPPMSCIDLGDKSTVEKSGAKD